MITIFAPVELGEHFQTVHRYFHEILVPFKQALDSIRQQVQVAVTNPQQQVVIDVSILRTTLERYNKLITNEESIILHCIRPQLVTGRPLAANGDLADCFATKKM
jgi:flavorubredoxin